jgi:outer membrane protein assembly factor BamB
MMHAVCRWVCAVVTRCASRIAWRDVALMLLALCAGNWAGAQQTNWIRLFSTPNDRFASQAAAMTGDESGIYVFETDQNTALDVLRKVDFDGRVIWTRRFEFVAGDRAYAADVAVDATGIYVIGHPFNVLSYVARFDSSGRLLWARALPQLDDVLGLAVHPSGVYVAGFKGLRAVIAKLDRDGKDVWSVMPFSEGVTVRKLAVDDTGLYASVENGNADVVKFDFNGRPSARFGSGGGSASALRVDHTGIYVTRGPYDIPPLIRRYAHDGRLIWSRRLLSNDGGTTRVLPTGISLDAQGVYIASWTEPHPSRSLVTRYSLNGNQIWSHEFGNEVDAAGIVVRTGQVYVAGSQYRGAFRYNPDTYLARVSVRVGPELQALRDVDGNDTSELAVLLQDAGGPAVLVKDSGTGTLVRRIALDAAYLAQQMVRLPNVDGHGGEGLAVLGVHRVNGTVAAEIRDARSGRFIGRTFFDNGYVPCKLVALPDVNGNATPELALLQFSDRGTDRGDPVVVRAEVRDSITGQPIRRIVYGSAERASVRGFVMVPDSNGNGSPELAVATALAEGSGAEVRDALTGAAVPKTFYDFNAIRYDGFPIDQQFAAMPDSNGNGGAELAALGDSFASTFIAEIVDAVSGTLDFNRVGRPRGLFTIPDLNGNGQVELALVSTNAPPGDTTLVQIKDGVTGAAVGNLRYQSSGYFFRGLGVVDDLNGNGSPELAVLQHRQSDDRIRAQIRDARTGVLIRTIDY